MVDILVSREIFISSYKKEYSVSFIKDCIPSVLSSSSEGHFIIDQNFYNLYENSLKQQSNFLEPLIIEATEDNKSLDKMSSYIEELLKRGVKRDHKIIAIGGGIIQDISCFISSTILRGIDWDFVPTTLLAQADSCIGSKSSINVGEYKNILGTFNPPNQIVIDVSFLETLDHKDICSGVGEIIKVHAIKGQDALSEILQDYDELFTNKELMEKYILNSLLYKKELIEIDEFDKGPRNIMNYGHSFGHAIESATNFKIPHGIAVSIGMDLANYVSRELGVSDGSIFLKMHETLQKNYGDFSHYEIPINLLIDALSKDKKNSSHSLKLILPNNEKLFIDSYKNNNQLYEICSDFLVNLMNA